MKQIQVYKNNNDRNPLKIEHLCGQWPLATYN